MKQNANHVLYEEARLHTTSQVRTEELIEKMRQNSESIPMPEMVTNIKSKP